MNWQDDPEIRSAEEERRAKFNLIRGVVIWMPFFLAAAAALLFFGFDRIFLDGGHGSTWFLVVVLAILSFLFGFQALQPLLNLLGEPRETAGLVMRRWARSDSLVIRTHYIRLETRQIFRLERGLHGDVKEGDVVQVRYYPHSTNVIRLQKLRPEDSSSPADRPAIPPPLPPYKQR